MIGYFEGIDSERGIAWRCADLFSLRDFLRLSNVERVPDHSWLSRTRSRLPHEAHETVFGWVLKLVAERGLVKGERIGVDGSTMEANAALRTIVRRDSGESYRAMLTRMAKESGVETPTAEDLARFDRKRKGKTLSNADWNSPTDRDARIAKMKDGTTHLAYKPEHAVDLDTGVVVAAPIHPADEAIRRRFRRHWSRRAQSRGGRIAAERGGALRPRRGQRLSLPRGCSTRFSQRWRTGPRSRAGHDRRHASKGASHGREPFKKGLFPDASGAPKAA